MFWRRWETWYDLAENFAVLLALRSRWWKNIAFAIQDVHLQFPTSLLHFRRGTQILCTISLIEAPEKKNRGSHCPCKIYSGEFFLAKVFSHKTKRTQLKFGMPNLIHGMQEKFLSILLFTVFFNSTSFSFLSAALLPSFLSVNKMWLDLWSVASLTRTNIPWLKWHWNCSYYLPVSPQKSYCCSTARLE